MYLLHAAERLLALEKGFCSMELPAVLFLPVKLTSSAYESFTQAPSKSFRPLPHIKGNCINYSLHFLSNCQTKAGFKYILNIQKQISSC
jgi:hypothetical protein